MPDGRRTGSLGRVHSAVARQVPERPQRWTTKYADLAADVNLNALLAAADYFTALWPALRCED